MIKYQFIRQILLPSLPNPATFKNFYICLIFNKLQRNCYPAM